MKIPISLNKKSIDNAIKQLERVKEQLQGEALNYFLKRCCEWVRDRANVLLNESDIGYDVKYEIQTSWEIGEPIGGVIKMTNNAEKAIYVEFGVGLIGGQTPHQNASATGYRYNVPSGAKFGGGFWSFNTDINTLDMPTDSVELQQSGNGYVAITQGTQGVMYAYNALVDLKVYGAKEVWEETKRKYWS